MNSDDPETLRPLKGVRVVEFCQIAAGPYCGMLLADFGADVIKVEPPEGDAMRTWPPLNHGYSENFASLNRGKRSIALDLKTPQDLEVARRLVGQADVLVENNRPGVMQRLGLGWDWFAQHQPQLVYCSISAFGQIGPRSADGGFDVTVQAISGLMSVTGEPQGGPVKAGVPVSDFASGLYGAFAIASVLLRVRQGGPGAHIDVPMMGASLGISALQTSEYFGTGQAPRKMGSAHPRNAPYRAFAASDGWFVVAAGNNRLWASVCEVVGLPELREDPRFLQPADRARHQDALKALLDPVFLRQPVSHWLSAFQAVGVPHAPIQDYAQALEDEQTTYLELVQPQTLPNAQTTRTVVSPIRMNGQRLPVRTTPPALNGHGTALREQGWGENGA